MALVQQYSTADLANYLERGTRITSLLNQVSSAHATPASVAASPVVTKSRHLQGWSTANYLSRTNDFAWDATSVAIRIVFLADFEGKGGEQGLVCAGNNLPYWITLAGDGKITIRHRNASDGFSFTTFATPAVQGERQDITVEFRAGDSELILVDHFRGVLDETKSRGIAAAPTISGTFWIGRTDSTSSVYKNPGPIDYVSITTDAGGLVHEYDLRSSYDDLAGSKDLTATGSLTLTDETTGDLSPTGKAVAVFDGGDDNLQASFGSTLAQPYTLFMVARRRATAANQFALDGIDGTNRLALYENSGRFIAFSGGNSIVAQDPSDGDWHVWRATVNGASSEVQIDNNSPVSGTLSSGLAGLTFGSEHDGTDAGAFDIAEVRVYNTASEDNDAIRSEMASTWISGGGKTISLASDIAFDTAFNIASDRGLPL